MSSRKTRKQEPFFALNGKRLFVKTLVAAMVLHASVVFGLVRISAETEEPRFTPLAVMDFSPFDPEGGNPGSRPGEASPVPTPPASPPPPEPVTEPEPEPSPAPDLVTTTSTKAVDEAPIPLKPEKKPEKKKDPKPKPIPKPKPKPVLVPQKKAPDPGPVLAGAEGNATGVGSGAEQGVPGGGTGTGTGSGPSGTGSGQGGVGGGTGRGNPDALKAYYGQIQKKLVRYKKYPRTAQMRHQEGVVTVFFVVDRSGKVVSSRIAKTSGHSLLDEEVLALLKRVNPFPPIPKEITREQLEITQSIRFEIK